MNFWPAILHLSQKILVPHLGTPLNWRGREPSTSRLSVALEMEARRKPSKLPQRCKRPVLTTTRFSRRLCRALQTSFSRIMRSTKAGCLSRWTWILRIFKHIRQIDMPASSYYVRTDRTKRLWCLSCAGSHQSCGNEVPRASCGSCSVIASVFGRADDFKHTAARYRRSGRARRRSHHSSLPRTKTAFTEEIPTGNVGIPRKRPAQSRHLGPTTQFLAMLSSRHDRSNYDRGRKTLWPAVSSRSAYHCVGRIELARRGHDRAGNSGRLS